MPSVVAIRRHGSVARPFGKKPVAGLDEDPRHLLATMQEFATALEESLQQYQLDWRGGEVVRLGEE
jgi:hypothetical protein